MAIIGIVAEYNPFHTGHARHIALSKKPGDTVVCCMSGHFVQRGDCAITDKWQRARWALMRGADLVVELPSRYALSSAEGFARKALEILGFAGMTQLSFGCETADLPTLTRVAEALNSPEYCTEVTPFLVKGVTFPAARQLWLEEKLGKETAAVVAKPNNALAVEYLRFLPENVTSAPVFRTGFHDSEWNPNFSQPPSASALRGLMKEGKDVSEFLPSELIGHIFDLKNAERAIFSAIRAKSLEELAAIPDSGEGVAQRLYQAIRTENSLEGLFSATKSRHITLARVRRVVLRAWLGLGANPASNPHFPHVSHTLPTHFAHTLHPFSTENAPQTPSQAGYLRVLGMTKAGSAHLKTLKSTCPVPIITKPAAHKELLAEEARLTDQFALCAPIILPSGEEFRRSPVVL